MFKAALAIIAVAVLAACASKEPATPAPVIVTPAPAPAIVTAPPQTVVVPAPSAPSVAAVPAVRPGFGRIEAIAALPPTASAGAGSKPMRRVTIRMDDGSVQVIDTATQGMSNGDRVELTNDGYLRHPA